MSKRYFISHSSLDKPLAIEIKELLEGDAWVDLHEIELGDLLLAKISSGIEEATDFVLLWSAASAQSKWVEFEFNMAFARWVQRQAISLRIVRLDSTKVPLHFEPFLQGRNLSSAGEVVSLLTGNSTEEPVRHRSFFNRNVEIGIVEDALYSNHVAAVWISGMGGLGKRSLARESINRLTAGTNAQHNISIGPGVAEPELNLLIANSLKVPAMPAGSSIEQITEHSAELIQRFSQAGGVWVFSESDEWLEDDATFGRMAIQVLGALLVAPDRKGQLAIFTSRRRPRVIGSWAEAIVPISLRGLSTNHAVTLLLDRGAKDSESGLSSVARELDGHPLALEIIAPQLPLDARGLADHRYSIATDLIDPHKYTVATWTMLEILAVVDGPLPVSDLAENLGSTAEEIQLAIAEASSFGVVDYSDLGFIYLHPILRDYFLRSYRKNSESKEKTATLASLSKNRFDLKSVDDADYVLSLLTTFKLLGMAGRFQEAINLRSGLIGTLFATANVLYQEKRWDESLAYLDEALTGNDDLDRDALGLKAKCLAYVGRLEEARAIGDALIARNAKSPKVLRDRGRIEFIARNWDGAIGYFEQALPLRKSNAQLYSDIAQALVRKEDWVSAAAAAKTAIDLQGDTPYTLNLYSQALEEQGLFEDAEEMIDRAIDREPRNSRYIHRSGRINLQLGHREEALRLFSRAVEINPEQVESWLSIASLKIESRDINAATHALEIAENLPGAPVGVIKNLQAKIHFTNGDLAQAQELIDAALAKGRDPKNLSLAIRIAVARAEARQWSTGQAHASVKLMAKELERGDHLWEIKDVWDQFPQYF